MPAITPQTAKSSIVYIEPAHLKPETTFKDVQYAMDQFSRTMRKHSIAPGFLAGFVVLDNQVMDTDALAKAPDHDHDPDPVILLTWFWKTPEALDRAEDNPLYQVLLDDVLRLCLSLEGETLHAPGFQFLSPPTDTSDALHHHNQNQGVH